MGIALAARAAAIKEMDESFIVGFRDQLRMYNPFNG